MFGIPPTPAALSLRLHNQISSGDLQQKYPRWLRSLGDSETLDNPVWEVLLIHSSHSAAEGWMPRVLPHRSLGIAICEAVEECLKDGVLPGEHPQPRADPPDRHRLGGEGSDGRGGRLSGSHRRMRRRGEQFLRPFLSPSKRLALGGRRPFSAGGGLCKFLFQSLFYWIGLSKGSSHNPSGVHRPVSILVLLDRPLEERNHV